MNSEKFKKIKSYKDIEIEKERLRYKISLSEERINNHFNSLTGKLTFEHLSSKIENSFLSGSIRFIKLVRWAFKLFTPKKKADKHE